MCDLTQRFPPAFPAYLLSVPLREVSHVIGKHGEVVRNLVVMAETNDHRQANTWKDEGKF